jgi:hypothetical protein
VSTCHLGLNATCTCTCTDGGPTADRRHRSEAFSLSMLRGCKFSTFGSRPLSPFLEAMSAMHLQALVEVAVCFDEMVNLFMFRKG